MAAELYSLELDDGHRWLPQEIFADVGICRQSPPPPTHLATDRVPHLRCSTKPPPFSLQESSFTNVGGPQRQQQCGFYEDMLVAAALREMKQKQALVGAGAGLAPPVYYPSCLPARHVQLLQVEEALRLQFEFEMAAAARVLGGGGVVGIPAGSGVRLVPVRSSPVAKKSGGTGVFLPRAAAYGGVNRKRACGPMKGEWKKGQQLVEEEEEESMKRGMAVTVEEEQQQQPRKPLLSLQPELVLPQEWTY